MPEANSTPILSNEVGQNPGHPPGATTKPKLPDRLRKALRFCYSSATLLLGAGIRRNGIVVIKS